MYLEGVGEVLAGELAKSVIKLMRKERRSVIVGLRVVNAFVFVRELKLNSNVLRAGIVLHVTSILCT